jgi:hypothetical protein
MSRTINLASMPLGYPPAVEWIEANELDPFSVLHRQEVYVDEHALTLERFILTVGKAKQLGPDGTPLTQKVTVPLLSPPDNHGL